MINELLGFGNSIESWGITIPSSCHRAMKRVPNVKTFLARLDLNGVVDVDEIKLTGLLEYTQGNHHRLLVKFDPKDSKKFSITVNKRFDDICNLVEKLKPYHQDHRLDSIIHLAEVISTLDSTAVANKLLDKLEDKNELCYFAFEVKDVWHKSCCDAINECLINMDDLSIGDNAGVDIFGNSVAGWETKGFVAALGCYPGGVRYYAKNSNNRVYTRFGLNSTAACKMGRISRRKIENILNFTMQHVGKLAIDPRLGYECEAIRGRHVVLVSLWPNEFAMDAPGYDKDLINKLKNLTPEEFSKYKFPEEFVARLRELDLDSEEMKDTWNQEIERRMDALRGEGECLKAPLGCEGHVVVLHKPPSSNGPWSVEYSHHAAYKKVAEQLNRWLDGIHNLEVPEFYFVCPNIFLAFKALNSRFKIQSGKVVKVKGKKDKKKHIEFTIADLYGFFFDDIDVIQRIASHLASNVIPYMISTRQGPYEFKYLYPICALTLHKLGVMKEIYVENSWAFCVGRTMQLANAMHKRYFIARGHKKVPPELIGHCCIKMIYSNPESGFALFQDRFQKYLNWHEGYKGYGVPTYRILMTKLMVILGGEAVLPIYMSDKDKIELGLGYSYNGNDEEKDNSGMSSE